MAPRMRPMKSPVFIEELLELPPPALEFQGEVEDHNYSATDAFEPSQRHTGNADDKVDTPLQAPRLKPAAPPQLYVGFDALPDLLVPASESLDFVLDVWLGEDLSLQVSEVVPAPNMFIECVRSKPFDFAIFCGISSRLGSSCTRSTSAETPRTWSFSSATESHRSSPWGSPSAQTPAFRNTYTNA